MTKIVLTEYEMVMTDAVGRARHTNAVQRRRDAGLGPSSRDAAPVNHIRGARCEYACALILNLYWRPTVGSIKNRDVGGIVEVRSTVRVCGDLFIKPDDNDTSPFVLISAVDAPAYEAVGWIMAGMGKSLVELKKGQNFDAAHIVPRSKLQPISVLFWMVHQKLARVGR